MKKWVPLLVLLVLVIGAWWVWSLGSLPSAAPATATLAQASGDVYVRVPNGDWRTASVGQSLTEGEEVRTGANGSAVLDFFGAAESRLDHNATVQVKALRAADDATSINLQLEVGRVWSRVLRLFDSGSGFAIETNDTVATVRGTSFDMQKLPGSATTTIWVASSVVDVTDPATKDSETATAIPDGMMLTFGKGIRSTSTQVISASTLASAWMAQNMEADRRLETSARQALRDQLAAKRPLSADGTLAVLRDFSEGLHVRLRSTTAGRELRARYLLRQLVGLRDLAENGRAGASYEQYNRLETQIRSLLGASSIGLSRRVLAQGTLLFADVTPDSPAYRLKQKWEDLGVDLAETPGEKIYRRLIGVDARLDEASLLIDQKRTDDALGLLDVSKQALQNIDRDRRDALDTLSPRMKITISRKLRALVIRERAMRDRLTALTAPGPVQGPVLPLVSTTSTSPLPTTTTSTKPTPPTTTTVSCVALSMTAQPNPVDVGSRSILTVTARRADGSTFNATSLATFRQYGNLGTLSKNVFTASAAGSINVEATVTCDGKPVVSQMVMQINAGPVKVKTLTLTGTPTRLLPGQRVTLNAMATYENGVTSMVTSQATYVSSDPQVGTMSGNVFVTNQSAGVATVTATYVENGVTVSASLTFTVALQ